MLKKLYVEPSSACNLNCKMCFRHNWFNEKIGIMNESVTKRVIATIETESFETLFIGGMGEPLLHNGIYSMIKSAQNTGKNTELITNATLLTKDNSKKLVESGLDFLWVSADGFSKNSYEQIRKGSLYYLLEKNLNSFNEVRGQTKLGITFVLMKENEFELENINRFADKFDVDLINLSHVIPSEELTEENSLYGRDYPIGKSHRFYSTKAEKKVDDCPFIKESACFIRYDGEVCPCMQCLHNSYSYLYTEKRKVYAKSYGNIKNSKLSEIWNCAEYKSFRDTVTNFDFPCCTICTGCELRLENNEDCMYNKNPTCGACLWSQGLIRCP